MPQVQSIYRYPVKGLSAEALPWVLLAAGETLPLDRAFALAHATAPFDPERPEPLAKTHFLMLMRNERLAALRTAYDAETGILRIERDGRAVAQACLRDLVGRRIVEQFFAAYLGEEVRGGPHLVAAPSHTFADCRAKRVSIIGLPSIRDLERVVHRPVDPLRFRANIYLEGGEPWQEFTWLDRSIRLGDAVLKVERRTRRCAATDVDPATAARDMTIPQSLQGAFGHTDMGVYAEVIEPGRVAEGDPLVPL